MKGLDTSVLVRYITQDDPLQSAVANDVIERLAKNQERFVIQPVVLCELVWVLESAYHYAKSDIVLVLNQLLRTAQFDIPEKDVVRQALGDFQSGESGFSDCLTRRIKESAGVDLNLTFYLIGRANMIAGADATLTFDESLDDSMNFQVLQ